MTILHTLLARPERPNGHGCIVKITPQSAGWTYVGFEVHRLFQGETLSRRNESSEICAVVLSGMAKFEVDNIFLAETGNRVSPFTPNVGAMLASKDAKWAIQALTPLEIAICSAPASSARAPKFIPPEDVIVQKRGSGTNTRFVSDFLPESRDDAESLLVVEAITPSGSWSSYPPHKHDEERLPYESRLEETYYHRINPSSGFAVQRVYTDDGLLDETYTVRDGDAVLVPRGYHPVGAPHGYELYYLNVMAGPRRIWRTQVDPRHAWLLKNEPPE